MHAAPAAAGSVCRSNTVRSALEESIIRAAGATCQQRRHYSHVHACTRPPQSELRGDCGMHRRYSVERARARPEHAGTAASAAAGRGGPAQGSAAPTPAKHTSSCTGPAGSHCCLDRLEIQSVLPASPCMQTNHHPSTYARRPHRRALRGAPSARALRLPSQAARGAGAGSSAAIAARRMSAEHRHPRAHSGHAGQSPGGLTIRSMRGTQLRTVQQWQVRPCFCVL
eukprot:jgi/Ulvmu1/5501/UM023_0037.1